MVAGRQLAAMKREVVFPFFLSLEPAEKAAGTVAILACREPLRLLPGRRLVCRARCGEEEVAAKLFIHARKAARDYEQELQGYRHFTAAGIQTPSLVAHGRINGGGYAVLYRYLDGAVPLAARIAPEPGDRQSREQLAAVLAVVARMHRAGFQQVDLHLDNFLWTGERQLYTLDCGDLALLPAAGPARAKQVRKNLAVLLSQLPLAYEPVFPQLLESYFAAATATERLVAAAGLEGEIRRRRWWRLRRYGRKAVRDCSEFAVEKSWRQLRICRRQYAGGPWRDFYQRLDELVAAGRRLKDGNSATVALVEWAGTRVVAKRYNIKGFRHWLRRCWRPSRGWHTWQNAQRLRILGLRTPEPVAMVERRWGWLRRRAYYVSLYEPAASAREALRDRASLPEKWRQEFSRLFQALAVAGISHGDMKADNFLLGEKGISLLDLDAMKFFPPRQLHRGRRLLARDLERFLRNWRDNEVLYRQFSRLIADLGLDMRE